jgi:hypothetical protein
LRRDTQLLRGQPIFVRMQLTTVSAMLSHHE